MEDAPVLARGDFAVGLVGLLHGAFFGEVDHAMEIGVVALEAIEVHGGEFAGGDRSGFDESCEVDNTPMGERFEILWSLNLF